MIYVKLSRRLLVAGTALAMLAGSVQALAAEFNWRMQSNLNAGEPGYESVRVNFVEVVERMTGGRMKIQMHPVGALFPITEGLEAVRNGIVEIGMMTGGYFSGKLGPIATLESGVPGAERSALERHAFFFGEGFLELAREAYAKYDVFYLGPHLSPPWDIISKKPLRSAKDFEGLKIRSFGIEAKWYESMGASVVFLGGGELYTALSTGVVDAVRWGSPANIHKLALHEVAKYLIQPSPMPAPNNNFLITSAAWKSLPDDIKAIMFEAAKLASLDYLARGAQLDAQAVKEMKSAGVEVIRIPEAEWASMEGNVRELWTGYAKEDPGLSARAVSMMQDYMRKLGR